jgi:hypothetical protein
MIEPSLRWWRICKVEGKIDGVNKDKNVTLPKSEALRGRYLLFG